MMKMRRNKRPIKNHGSLELIKKKLDEGLMVELSSSSDDGELDDQPQQLATRNEELPSFESITSSIEAEMREILSELDNSSEPDWPDLSDPDLEGAIINLMGPREGKLCTPFQLTDKIKRELVRRAKQTGVRALDWTMSTFNKVGDVGTLRAV